MIRLTDVTKRHNGKAVVDGVSLEAKAGEILALLGPSGSGKTTLLRLIAGLDRPDAGKIEIGGEDVTARPAHERGVAMVFQHLALWPNRTVRGNLEFGPRLRAKQLGVLAFLRRFAGGGRERERFEADLAAKVKSAADMLHIETLLERMPDQLSGGERQRAALARALIREPKVLLLDEPFSNLDADLRVELRGEVRRIQKQLGITAVLVTHDRADADAVSDRVIRLAAGRVVSAETSDADRAGSA